MMDCKKCQALEEARKLNIHIGDSICKDCRKKNCVYCYPSCEPYLFYPERRNFCVSHEAALLNKDNILALHKRLIKDLLSRIHVLESGNNVILCGSSSSIGSVRDGNVTSRKRRSVEENIEEMENSFANHQKHDIRGHPLLPGYSQLPSVSSEVIDLSGPCSCLSCQTICMIQSLPASPDEIRCKNMRKMIQRDNPESVMDTICNDLYLIRQSM